MDPQHQTSPPELRQGAYQPPFDVAWTNNEWDRGMSLNPKDEMGDRVQIRRSQGHKSLTARALVPSNRWQNCQRITDCFADLKASQLTE